VFFLVAIIAVSQDARPDLHGLQGIVNLSEDPGKLATICGIQKGAISQQAVVESAKFSLS
jgi:hypothetical protein